MSMILNSVIFIGITTFLLFCMAKIRKMHKAKKFIDSINTFLTINFIDYKADNYFNEINIKIEHNSIINKVINEKYFYIPILTFKNKSILESSITIKNTKTNELRAIKVSLYKDCVNNINIYLNNISDEYYSPEIIVFGETNEVKLNNNYKCDNSGLKKRLRCCILNIEKTLLLEIIKNNNNYNDNLNLKIPQVLNNLKDRNILINIFIGNNASNVLIFGEEKQKLITANENEKYLISEFYRNVNKNIDSDIDINQFCESFRDTLLSNEKLFGLNIQNINDDTLYNIIFSYINQGTNYFFDNNILSERDNDFIYGCLILLLYSTKNIYSIDYDLIKTFNKIIKKMKKNKFDVIEQIKAAIAFTSFYINDAVMYTLKITDKLSKDSPYKKAFDFYEEIIDGLNEESELMLMFLQLNSGFGKELLNNKTCYKISMVSIQDIKEHLKRNIPKYFFCYNTKNGENIAIPDPKTQIIGFNEQQIFEKKGKEISENEIKNNIMNVLICIFHEGGHQKFHMNINSGSSIEPVLFITKQYSLGSQDKLIDNSDKRGESGMCVDYYLYYFSMFPSQILIRSSQTHKLFNKEYYIGKLDELNKKSLEIIGDYLSKNNMFPNKDTGSYNIEAMNNLIRIFNEEDNNNLDDDFITINGEQYFCSSKINY